MLVRDPEYIQEVRNNPVAQDQLLGAMIDYTMAVVDATYDDVLFRPPSSAILVSVLGPNGAPSQRQVNHCDFDATNPDARKCAAAATASKNRPVSMGAIITFQDGTKFTYIPQSLKIVRHLAADEKNTWAGEVPAAITATIPRNMVQLFTMDTVHAGEEYAAENARAFFYIDHPDVKRAVDTTYTPNWMFKSRGSILERK
jgi:hypothetical protein